MLEIAEMGTIQGLQRLDVSMTKACKSGLMGLGGKVRQLKHNFLQWWCLDDPCPWKLRLTVYVALQIPPLRTGACRGSAASSQL